MRPHPLVIRLAERREALGMSRADVTAEIGLGRRAVWAWETGRGTPRLQGLDAYARAVGLALTLHGEEPPAPADGPPHPLVTRIVAHRKAVRMSQATLALKAKITNTGLCLIERGRHTPQLATLELLLAALGLRLDLVPVGTERTHKGEDHVQDR